MEDHTISSWMAEAISVLTDLSVSILFVLRPSSFILLTKSLTSLPMEILFNSPWQRTRDL
jgi:hypothetical protein